MKNFTLFFLCLTESIFVFLALYNAIKILLKVPSERVTKCLSRALSRKREKLSPFVALNDNLAILLARLIRLNEYKRERLAGYLSVSQSKLSPEVYTAQAFIPFIECAFFAVLLFAFGQGFLGLALIGLGIWQSSKSYKRVNNYIKIKQQQIDSDLPRFVLSLINELDYSHDVVTLLEKHKNDYSQYWSYEMSITIADMRSGNYVAALQRLRSRIRSKNMNDVVNELIMMSRGYDTTESWRNLELRFRELGIQELRKRAKLVPEKLRNLALPLVFGVLLIYGVVLITALFDSIKVFNL